MKKRKLFVGVLLASAVFSLAACSGDKTTTTGVTTPTTTEAGNNTSTVAKYTVTFNSNGGTTVSPVQIDNGGKVTKPNDPTKAETATAKYTFGGWYKEATCTNAFNFTSDTITADTTLYAKWDVTNKYVVTFNVDGGTEVTSQTVYAGGKATTPANPTKTETDAAKYDFAGWYKDASCTTAFDFTAETINANTTVYAKWDVTNKYVVTFDVNGGSNVESQTIYAGGKVTAPTANPTKENDNDYKYTFAGWYKDASCTTAFDFDTETINEATTIYAKWDQAPITYTVTFDVDGGNEVGPQEITKNGKVTRPANPTKDEDDDYTYTFDGWYTDDTYAKAFDFDTEITSATTIYAKWIEKAKTISLTLNSDNVSKELEIGQKIDLSSLVVTAKDSEGQSHILAATDYLLSVKDASNNEFDTSNELTTTGKYTITVSYEGFSKDFTIEVKAKQYKYTFNFSGDSYNNSLDTQYTENYTFPNSATTTLFDNNSFKVEVKTGAENDQCKLLFDQARGTYTSCFQVHSNDKKGHLLLTAKASGKITIYYALGGSAGANDRKLQIIDAYDPTNIVMESAQVTTEAGVIETITFNANAGDKFKITSSKNGALIYAIDYSLSVDETTVVAVDNFTFVPAKVEFNTTDDKFNFNNVEGVATAYNNYSVPTVVTTGLTYTVKDSTDTVVTEITAAGTYTVTVEYEGKSVSYTISVADANAPITAVNVDSSDAKKKFYVGDSFEAKDLTVTAEKGAVTVTLDESEYTIKLYKDTTEVTEFTDGGEYKVRVYANGTEVYGEYTINYYTVKSITITADATKSVAIGSTSFDSGAKVTLTYTDDTTKDVTNTLKVTLYSDNTYTTETTATAAFAAAGTAYAKLEANGAETKYMTLNVVSKQVVTMPTTINASANGDKTVLATGITFVAKSGSKVDTVSVTVEGESITSAINTQGKSDSKKNYLEIDLSSLAANESKTVTIYMAGAGSGTRTGYITNKLAGAADLAGTDKLATIASVESAMANGSATLNGGAKYYFVYDNSVRIYAIVIE